MRDREQQHGMVPFPPPERAHDLSRIVGALSGAPYSDAFVCALADELESRPSRRREYERAGLPAGDCESESA